MLENKILSYLQRLKSRQALPVRVYLWNGSSVALSAETPVSIHLNTPGAARYFLRPNLAALGEAFVEGLIDFSGPIRHLMPVVERLAQVGGSASRVGPAPSWLRLHTLNTDRRAVRYHYDVSNEFYARWLDAGMVYSCAYFRTGDESLAQAQTDKLDLVCRKLRLAPGQSLLDIGCGWGALVEHAARHYGVNALGITLSSNQASYAAERIRAAGLADRVQIRLTDYRELAGENLYDRIASVGMFEHVGLKNLPRYFETIHRLLKPGGVVMNHGITASDPSSRSVGLGAGKFIGRYVFPDGELPHVSLAIHALASAGLELVDAESLRRHYAKTLWHWSDAFERELPALVTLAGEKRARIWRVYLAGCAHGFAHEWMNIYQLLAIKAVRGAAAAESPLPLTRDYMYRS